MTISDLVRLISLFHGPQITAKHQWRLDNAPKGEHGSVLGERHATLADKEGIGIVPTPSRSLARVKTELIVAVDVFQQTVPMIAAS